MNLNLSYKLSKAYDLLYQKNFNRSYEKSRETLPSAVIEFLSLNSNFDEISKQDYEAITKIEYWIKELRFFYNVNKQQIEKAKKEELPFNEVNA